jgi:hypothetical protein
MTNEVQQWEIGHEKCHPRAQGSINAWANYTVILELKHVNIRISSAKLVEYDHCARMFDNCVLECLYGA